MQPNRELIASKAWYQLVILHGEFEADIFAGYLCQVGAHYNPATILVERNNHGHAVLLALEYASYEPFYISPMDKKLGWYSSQRDKVLAVDNAARALREG